MVGFYFLDLATSYEPPLKLEAFLAAGNPPVYIGCVYFTCSAGVLLSISCSSFGSIVVDDPKKMTREL